MRFLPILALLTLCAILFFQLTQPGAMPREEGWPIGQPVPPVILSVLPKVGIHPEASLPLNFIDSNGGQKNGYILNFFASWCGPCIAEIPQLQTLARQHGIPVVGVAWKDSPEALQKFFREHGRPYTQVLLDDEGAGMTELGATGVPETFLVDGTGVIRRRIRTNLQPSDLPAIAARLQAMPAKAKP